MPAIGVLKGQSIQALIRTSAIGSQDRQEPVTSAL